MQWRVAWNTPSKIAPLDGHRRVDGALASAQDYNERGRWFKFARETVYGGDRCLISGHLKGSWVRDRVPYSKCIGKLNVGAKI